MVIFFATAHPRGKFATAPLSVEAPADILVYLLEKETEHSSLKAVGSAWRDNPRLPSVRGRRTCVSRIVLRYLCGLEA